MSETGLPSGRELVALKNLVQESFTESNWIELGVLTDTLDAIKQHPRLLRSMSFADPDYAGHVLYMLNHMIAADPAKYKVVADYIYLTCPETGEFVSSADEHSRRIVFTPIVFKVPGVK